MNILIVGGGGKINYLVKSFLSKGHDVTVIENNYELCRKLSKKYKANFIFGDGTKPYVLEDAGISHMSLIIALTPLDQNNLVICQLAKVVYKVNKTVASVNDPENIELFKRLGLDIVISTTDIISSLIEQRAFIEDMDNLFPIEEGKVALMELEIQKDSPVLDKKIKDIGLPDQSIIGCIIRNTEAIIPNGEDKILSDDKLIVLSLPKVQSKVLKIITGKVE